MFFCYIMANRKNGTLYLGQTDDLARRVWEHKTGIGSTFTREHGCGRLVWFEGHETRLSAFTRERQMKAWRRDWKISRIQALNPHWDDLHLTLTEADIYAPQRQYNDDTLFELI